MSRSNAWCVYILSNHSHTLYVGSTNDLLRRRPEHELKVHAKAFTARYTFNRVVYIEFVADESSRAREMQIKGWTRARKVSLIQERNPNWADLMPSLLELLRLD